MCVVLVGGTLSGSLAWAESGTLSSVVVYPDRAVVTRQLTLQLGVGTNAVRFEDLPPTLDVDTLQAEGAGLAGTRIIGLDVRDRELAEDRRARIVELEAQIEAAQDALRTQKDLAAAAELQRSFLGKLEVAAAKQLSAELLFSDQAARQSQGILGVLATSVSEAQALIRQAEVEQRAVQAQLSALQRTLADVRGAAQWARRDVVVQVEADQAGEATLSVTYALRGASWTPVYDVHGKAGEPNVDVTLYAQVTQTTGEDWSGVKLSLSTARPSRGVAAPVLAPFWIQPAQTYPSYRYEMDDSGADFESMPMMEEEQVSSKVMAAPPPPAAPMRVQVAEVASEGAAVRFDVPGGSDVPGDGGQRKLKVTVQSVPVTWRYEAAPRVDPAAYVSAAGSWNASWPMLPGKVSYFSSGDFIGAAPTAGAGPGEELRFGFGQDDSVQVKLTVLEDSAGLPDWMGKVTRRRLWQTSVHNGRGEAVELWVRDVLPRASMAHTKVRALGDAPTELGVDGLEAWTLSVAPGGDGSVKHGYQVRYPRKSPPGVLP